MTSTNHTATDNPRIYLSSPDMSEVERSFLLDAFDSNWVAPVGPDLDAFEVELGRVCDRPHVAALASGTAAIQLGLQILGVERGDEVLVSSFTFVATANAALHLGARPTFVDSDAADWNLDVDLTEQTLAARAAAGKLPAAVISVDLYGQCADYERLEPVCATYGVPLIADAAEAIGASRAGRAAGSHGALAAVSFNGNKIMTTGGGGALLADDPQAIARARFLATQAREAGAAYEHTEAGYNFRLSNILAALGRGQLERLESMIERRRQIHLNYRSILAGRPGVAFMPIPEDSRPNHWLTVITIEPDIAGTDREQLRLALEAANIESRPAWKPMHRQPLFRQAEMIGGAVSDQVFERGLCLPSGSNMTDGELDRVNNVLVEQFQD